MTKTLVVTGTLNVKIQQNSGHPTFICLYSKIKLLLFAKLLIPTYHTKQFFTERIFSVNNNGTYNFIYLNKKNFVTWKQVDHGAKHLIYMETKKNFVPWKQVDYGAKHFIYTDRDKYFNSPKN